MNFQRALALAGALALATLPAGCAPARSVKAYCSTMEDHKASYLSRYAAGEPTAGDLGALLRQATSAIQAMGDTVVIFEDLARVAPEEIRSDVEAVRDSLKQQQQAMGDLGSDPLGSIVGTLLIGLTNSGSWQRVDEWTRTNCDAGAA